jgi:hypothetical protein
MACTETGREVGAGWSSSTFALVGGRDAADAATGKNLHATMTGAIVMSWIVEYEPEAAMAAMYARITAAPAFDTRGHGAHSRYGATSSAKWFTTTSAWWTDAGSRCRRNANGDGSGWVS